MHTAQGVPDAPVLRALGKALGWALAGSGDPLCGFPQEVASEEGEMRPRAARRPKAGFQLFCVGSPRSWASDIGSPAHRAGRGSSIQDRENVVFTL